MHIYVIIYMYIHIQGASLLPGDLIALVKLDDPDKVVKSVKFTGVLVEDTPVLGDDDDASASVLPHVAMREARHKLQQILEGYPVPENEADLAMASYLLSFSDKLLPVYEVIMLLYKLIEN
jgi:hypothetical protein